MTPRPSASTHIQLTLAERATLLANVDPPNALDEILRDGRVLGPVVHIDLDDNQLGTFLAHLEQASNIALNLVDASTLSHALLRIQAGFMGTVDPGWHILRPAIARLGFTAKQGQYLAFIHLYTRLNRRSPAESDIQAYFRTSPPVVHQTLRALQEKGFIARERGVPRSIRLLLPPHAIPELE